MNIIEGTLEYSVLSVTPPMTSALAETSFEISCILCLFIIIQRGARLQNNVLPRGRIVLELNQVILANLIIRVDPLVSTETNREALRDIILARARDERA